jgi:hypothetical protein
MEPQEKSAFEAAILSYWRAPDAGAIIRLFAAEPVGERWRAATVLTLPVFLAQVIDRAPEAGAALVDAMRGGDPVKVEIVAQALNYCHHADRRRLMERLVGEQAAGAMDLAGADFLDLRPTHPVHVDMLWAAFFATGAASYVERIAQLLGGWMHEAELQALLAVAAKDESVREKALGGVLANAALWSLTVNARDLPEVKVALDAYAQRADGLGSALAARILAGITG